MIISGAKNPGIKATNIEVEVKQDARIRTE
jgi:hypothetical protein